MRAPRRRAPRVYQIGRVEASRHRIQPGAGDAAGLREGVMPAELAGIEQEAGLSARRRGLRVVHEGAHRLRAAGDEEAAGAQPAGRLPALLLETRQEVEQVRDGRVAVRRRLPGDVAGRVPGRARAEAVALQQGHRPEPAFGQVPRDAGADDAAADDQEVVHGLDGGCPGMRVGGFNVPRAIRSVLLPPSGAARRPRAPRAYSLSAMLRNSRSSSLRSRTDSGPNRNTVVPCAASASPHPATDQ